MKKILVCGVFLSSLMLATTLPAVTQPAKSPAPAAAQTEATTKADTMVIEGVVKKLDDSTALFTEDKVYPLVGGDFKMIVGKKVHIIGRKITEAGVEKIEVARVQFERK